MSTITAKLTSGMVVQLSNGRHEWRADEPTNVGGTDSGPTPYEQLLGALAACTCITIAMYCQRKQLPLESISASYDFSRVHAEDCADCDRPSQGFIEKIKSRVHFEGNFDAAQRKRLADIVERCPVHKTLAQGVEFEDNATFEN